MKKYKFASLVTGASKRIGKEISIKLASENKNVVIHYNKSEKAAISLSKELNKKFKVFSTIIEADLSKPDQLKELFSTLKKKKNNNRLLNK